MNIKTVVAEFAERLSALVETQAFERARAAVMSAFGGRGPGRPPKAGASLEAAPAAKKARKKMPRQLCPVPGCKNTAAPIFGMVCAQHKDLPKARIKQFREARRAKKLGLPAPKAAKRRAASVANKARPAKATKTNAAKRKTTKARAKARPKTDAAPVSAAPPAPSPDSLPATA